MSIKVRKPTPELVVLFQEAANTLVNFAQLWTEIKQKGIEEGFTVKELEQIFRQYLKTKGLGKDKIYYLFHREEQIQRVNENNRKFTTEIDKLQSIILQQNARIEELETARELDEEERDRLSVIKDKIKKHEEEYLKFYNEVEKPWLQRQTEIVLAWCEDLEVKYNILDKPIGNILKDIVFQMKFQGIKGGLIYESIPDKYKVNYTKSRMLYDGDNST